MANEIDRFMDMDALKLGDRDLDALISYVRKHVQNIEAGVKPKKDVQGGLELLGKLGMAKKPEKLIRRI